MRNWAIALLSLALVSGLACLGANTPDEHGVARVLMVLFGVLGAYAATAHLLRGRARPGHADGAIET
ncbi:hypothetical protein [Limimaricola pyoseonensis]|uniref:Uncharacterized protein n=1 Tax=Limimaricola pyoseonensis TaxID=521013 RepID=A0A1G7C8P1_9RHOB|nr:hypothetical protein [Limimaricola pyoseonensis]SDE35752.1 hypothetical protein SAMN04488567_1404 [Limimaricola pyoseonensis]